MASETAKRWATDAAYDSPGNAWDTDPNKSEPSSDEFANGFEPTEHLSAQKLNSVLNHASIWAGYFNIGSDELVYKSTRARKITIEPGLGQPISQADPWVLNSFWFWESAAATKTILFPISPFLNTGNVLQTVKVMMDPGGSSAVQITLYYRQHNFTTPTSSVNSITSASSSGDSVQNVSLSALARTVARPTEDLFIGVLSGQAGDQIFGIEVGFDDLGPRNF